MSKISRFTKKAVQLAKNAVGGRGEVAAPEGGDGFADYAPVSLHRLWVYLDKSYREALDLLSEMPHILGGVQSLHTNSSDEPLALSSEVAVQVVLEIQQILAEKSGIADIVDPMRGFVIEEMMPF